MFVDRAASLRNDAFPTFSLRAFPRRRIVDQGDALEWWFERKLSEEIATLFEWQRRDVAAVEPHDVKHVICNRAAAPRDLTIED